jgi:hypothetical protein
MRPSYRRSRESQACISGNNLYLVSRTIMRIRAVRVCSVSHLVGDAGAYARTRLEPVRSRSSSHIDCVAACLTHPDSRDCDATLTKYYDCQSAVGVKVGVLGLLAQFCFYASTIPLCMMCCCSEKPEQVRSGVLVTVLVESAFEYCTGTPQRVR